MKFPYMVVHNGIEYTAGMDVPVDEVKESEPAEISTDEIVEQKYSKTEISRMSVGELRQLATEKGIDGAETKSGAELKKDLVKALGL